MEQKQKKGLNISTKSFIVALAVLFALMIVTYILTFFIQAGEYARIEDENGNLIIDMSVPFRFLESVHFPFWKWLLSPVLVLGADGSVTVISVIAFLIIIGGIFNSLDKCGFLGYMLGRIIAKFGHKRYTLLFLITLFFMAMGAFAGSFEECVPLVPIVVALAVKLGWDELTGLGMSVVAVGCGFATGILNAFTLGVAQTIAGLPMFSGIWLRLVSGVLIYALLALFLYFHAKKVEKPISIEKVEGEVPFNKKMNRALVCFASILGTGVLLIFLSTFIKALQDVTSIVIVVMFLLAGIPSALLSGMSLKKLGVTFFNGVVSILPAILMILMASSVKYILTEAKILDTILYYATIASSKLNPYIVVLFLYLIALVMNFFVPSGSAEAFILIPLMVPIATLSGISSQLCVLTFVYGDGFSNVLYPTNAVLLISLGLANVSYGKYLKWAWKLQLAILVLTSVILLFAQFIGY